MVWTRRIVNALRRQVPHRQSAGRQRPKSGVLTPRRAEDSVRDYPSAGLTPSRLSAILREADDGSLATPMQLFEEMEEKDAHLFAVANTRRLAVTGLSWEITNAVLAHNMRLIEWAQGVGPDVISPIVDPDHICRGAAHVPVSPAATATAVHTGTAGSIAGPHCGQRHFRIPKRHPCAHPNQSPGARVLRGWLPSFG